MSILDTTASLLEIPVSAWILNGILVVVLSMALTGILIPRILLISYRKKLFDVPDCRKIHRSAVPRLGGMAFMPAIVLSIATVAGINLIQLQGQTLQPTGWAVTRDAVEICFGLVSLMMLYLVGLADDLIGVKYRAKFVVQIIAGMLLVSSGMIIDNLHGFLGIHEMPIWIGALLTILVTVLVINAINLIDGIDGLASGLSAIALAFYGIVCFNSELSVCYMLACAALGTLVPFYYYNVFGNASNNRKIFMGDTGALTTGFILIFIALKVSELPLDNCFHADSLVVAFSPLVVPCLDVVRVFFHRIRKGHSPFQPGRTHIHHKFLALGVNQSVAMLLILLISAAFILIDVWMSPELPVLAILLIDLAIWAVLNLALTSRIRRRQRKAPQYREMYD